jgi:hypothetical protein
VDNVIANADFVGVAYSGTEVVAVGRDNGLVPSGGKCIRSTDGGISWTEKTLSVAPFAVVWDETNGVFVAVGSDYLGVKTCATSPTGETWTDKTSVMPTGDWRAVATDGAGLVVAVGASVAATSTDGGASWTARTIPSGSYASVAWTGSGFVAVGGSGGAVCATSGANGQTWTSKSIPNSANAVASSGSVTVAVGSSASVSLDGGATWTSAGDMGTGTYAALVNANGVWIALGDAYTATSPDGFTWSERISGTLMNYASGCVVGRRLVGVGNESDAAFSMEW